MDNPHAGKVTGVALSSVGAFGEAERLPAKECDFLRSGLV